MDNNFFAANIREIRKAQNRYQADVAEELGIARQTYSNYETGARTPNVEMIQKIAKLYHTTMTELLTPPDNKLQADASTGEQISNFDKQNIKEQPSSVLNYYEQRLIALYKALPDEDQRELINYASFKLQQHQDNKNNP